ncbi:PAS domain-containing protein [Spirosoma sp. BT704]|uniref:histidine kinase n=2 Tax=Spirosoma validum TaxID=2771355 RepID=A0A927B5X8_9BACT|nr:PAS domain-containing protein [Spirosoma validum]
MWSLDIEKGTYWYSARFMNWLGLSEETKNLDEAYNPLPDAYRPMVVNAIAATIQPGSSGLYENEHPIINRLTGQERIIHVQGQVVYDESGKPVTLNGTAQDVTQHRQLQLALEQLVYQRTEELAVANATLAATNVELLDSNTEYASVNEDLEEANDLLKRSNENLQQFAYIASHDLQEPLRKIQQFGDLLRTRFAPSSSEELVYLERMQSAASRMSTLIRDLLNFSRISTQRDTSTAVSLTTVLQTVLADLELTIQDSGAQIKVDTLPTIYGDSIQLGQLFQNLLSNALKFHKPGIAPHIDVTTRLIETTELPSTIKPTRLANRYHRIDVVDNGVGFDEKYLDRIFQVFQRLHGKSEFAGTGIGLAICKKVATNHGGDITAISQLNQGSTFSVYLPAE